MASTPEHTAALAGNFAAHLVAALSREAVRPPGEVHLLAVQETFALLSAVFDADGTYDASELDALIVALEPLTKSAGTTADDIRRSGVLADRAEWLRHPSELFCALVAQDIRLGGSDAWRYRDLAADLTSRAAEADGTVSAPEVAALAGYLHDLNCALSAAGLEAPDDDIATTARLVAELERCTAELRAGGDVRATLLEVAALAGAELAALEAATDER